MMQLSPQPFTCHGSCGNGDACWGTQGGQLQMCHAKQYRSKTKHKLRWIDGTLVARFHYFFLRKWPAEESLPRSIKEQETHWLRRALSLPQHKVTKRIMLMGIWGVTGSTQLQNLAVKISLVFSSTPSGNKLVGICNRMGMKFASVGGPGPVVNFL
eukprot:751174-Pelagomonas_calceolata.AAC.1